MTFRIFPIILLCFATSGYAQTIDASELVNIEVKQVSLHNIVVDSTTHSSLSDTIQSNTTSKATDVLKRVEKEAVTILPEKPVLIDIGQANLILEETSGLSPDQVFALAKQKLEADDYLSFQLDSSLADPEVLGENLEQRIMDSEYGEALQNSLTESDIAKSNANALIDQAKTKPEIPDPTDLLQGQLEGLDKARNKLLKYKSRFPSVPSIEEMPKNPFKRHPLADSAWHERIRYGLQYQMSERDGFNIDIGPVAAYKLTDLFSVGAYGSLRVNFNKQQSPFVSIQTQKIYGGGVYLQHEIKKGFFGRVSYEALNSDLSPEMMGETPEAHHTYSGLRFGLGKELSIAGKLQLYTIVEYSFNESLYNPFRKQVQLRMGILIH